MNLLVKTCNYGRMNAQRAIARIVVGLGIFVNGAAVVGAFARMGYTANTPLAYATTAAIPLAMAVIVFAVGMFYEYLAAVLLAVGVVGLAIWGLVEGWEASVWAAMVVVVLGPMILAAVLYLLAAQTQRVCELEDETAK